MATSAPAFARAIAVARPMPEAPPVTQALLPVRYRSLIVAFTPVEAGRTARLPSSQPDALPSGCDDGNRAVLPASTGVKATMSDRYLTGKSAWVTGGASGMGRATAIALAKAGADVAIGSLVASQRGAVLADQN